MYKVKSPLLFLVFNRPDLTKRVFDVIAAVQPNVLYIASDGPRTHVEGERAKVEAIRETILQGVTWPCQVHTLFQEKNLGCKNAVSGAISWFFATERRGIILEDDCLPATSFFAYCDELLERFESEPKVMSISGYSCLPEEKTTGQDSYFFSKYFHCWGWATWRRSWETYDKNINTWNTTIKNSFLGSIQRGWLFRNYWKKNFDRVAEGKIDTWDFQMVYNIWEREGLCCTPHINLVSNIGFGPEATHTKNAEDSNANMRQRELDLPLAHPRDIRRNQPLDKVILKVGYRLTPSLFLRKKVNNSLSSLLAVLRKKDD